MADQKQSNRERLREITEGIEQGVPSRFMRKFICRLRLSEVSRQ